MVDFSGELNLDRDRLERRIVFLIDRAGAHEQKESDYHFSCAATLLRDAGGIALLLGHTERAKGLLFKAGRLWADLGVLSGYFLMSLAQPSVGTAWFENEPELDRVAESLDSSKPYEGFSVEGALGLSRRTRKHSPRQLLSLFQAAGGGRRRSERAARLAKFARGRLEISSDAVVGSVGVPLPTYLQLYDALATGDLTLSGRNSLSALVVRRDEMISAAQRDWYHWRLLQRPTEVIDFDILALGIAAVEAGGKALASLLDVISSQSLAGRLPLELAGELYKPQ